jgi:heme A synthase
LIGAFLVVFVTAAVSRRSRGTTVRGLAVLAASLAGLQVLLGVEAWMIRFKAGFLLSPTQAITQGDALIRSLHVLIGYGLFATVVGLAAVLIRSRGPTVRTSAIRRPEISAEVLV